MGSVIEEPMPDVSVERSHSGLQDAKDSASCLFNDEDYEQSGYLLSKAIWCVDVGQIVNVPVRLSCVLRTNRAAVHIKADRFEQALDDCSCALSMGVNDPGIIAKA